MRGKWEHPGLGRFRYDGIAWVARVEAPGFDVFSDPRYRRRRDTRRTYELAFFAEDEHELPAPKGARLAVKVPSRSTTLARKAALALWDEFTGRGPRTGMWWHGALDEVNEKLRRHNRSLSCADDVYSGMELSLIAVRTDVA